MTDISTISENSSAVLGNPLDKLIVTCPHCKDPVIIQKINCAIFRHGSIKKTGKQMKPHLNQAACEELIKNNLIYGCGKPFRIVNGKAVVCEYI